MGKENKNSEKIAAIIIFSNYHNGFLEPNCYYCAGWGGVKMFWNLTEGNLQTKGAII